MLPDDTEKLIFDSKDGLRTRRGCLVAIVEYAQSQRFLGVLEVGAF
jgi:hypothetical protein